MKTTRVAMALAFVVLPCAVPAQNVRFEFGTTLNAVLSDSVDARKNRPGDTVKAKCSEDVSVGGLVVIPRGAKLVGRVTEAQTAARANEPARLGLIFDRAELKDGSQVALRATLFALAAPEGAVGASNPFGGFGGGLGGGSAALGNMVNTSERRPADDSSALGSGGAPHEELKPSPGAIGGLNGSGSLYASSRGVFGMDEISLEPPNTIPSAGSVVVLANARSVHLSSGTRMLLSVEPPGSGK